MHDEATSMSLRASEAGLGVSGGAASLGLLQITTDLVILGSIGLIMSVVAFMYDYSHANIKVPNRTAFWSALALHIVFGAVALPAGFMATYVFFTQEITVCMLAGIFSAWSVVAIAKSIRSGLSDKLRKGEFRL